MSVTLMKTSTPRAGDEENRFPTHYIEAGQMARFSSTSGFRYNNGKDMIALLVMYIMVLRMLHPDRHRTRLHHLGAESKVSPSSGSSSLEDVSSVGIVLLWCRQSCVRKMWVNV